MVANTTVLFNKSPEGMPTMEAFRIVSGEFDECQDIPENSLMVKLVSVSVDPWLRPRMSTWDSYVPSFTVGKPITNFAVGKILISKNSRFEADEYVQGILPWSDYAIFEPDESYNRIPKQPPFPLSYYLGVLGMPGKTAYFGLLQVCQPKSGETVFVSSAAGAVGQLVGQLGKTLGLRVVGSAGGPKKCEMLRSLGFDAVIDYKTCDNLKDFTAQLKQACPKGIDCYFDGVGGYQLDAALAVANKFARFCECGMISQYNMTDDDDSYPFKHVPKIIGKEITMKGMIYATYEAIHGTDEFFDKVSKLLQSKQISYTVDEIKGGIKDCPAAFIRMLKGENFGKQVVSIERLE